MNEIEIKDGKTKKRIILRLGDKESTEKDIGTCRQCKCNYRISVSRIYKREGFCGKRCKRYFLKNSHKWRSGKTKQERQKNRQLKLKMAKEFYRSDEWRKLRFSTLRKYGFSCLACGRKPPEVILHVDHIKPKSKYPELALDPSNLQVLCAVCNVGKGAKFEDDLRSE